MLSGNSESTNQLFSNKPEVNMNINRRSFLKRTLAAGSMAVGTGSLLSACSSLRRGDLPQQDFATPVNYPLDQTGVAILYHAALAPSGHNAQPWFVRIVKKNEWVIGLDPQRRLPEVDPDNREALLSLGAFAENLSLAAGSCGYKAEMEIIAENRFEQDIIKVALIDTGSTDYPLERLKRRMTAKQGYLPDEIKKEDMQALSEPLKGRLFYFPKGTEHADCIEEGAIENFRIQVNRDNAQQELVRWVRLSNKDAERHRDGLTVAGMEIRGFKGWFVRNFIKPRDFMKPSFRQQSIDLTAKLARQGGGWLIITSEGQTVADLIETGRRFESMALTARERNLAIHPMTQYLEEKDGAQQIAVNHAANVIPQFILRVGYLKNYPEPVSLRRPVSWFVRS
jgi:nitroreductase